MAADVEVAIPEDFDACLPTGGSAIEDDGAALTPWKEDAST